MSTADRHAELRARNEAMRERVDGLLGDLRRQTDALKAVQQQAIAVTGSASSSDGSVAVTVNAAGVVTGVKLAPSTFDRTTPDKLARTITEVAREAAADARARTESILDVPVGLSIQDLRPAKTARPERPVDDDLDDDVILRSDR